MNIMKINTRYKTSAIGVYNRDVFECPECGKNISEDYYKHICGIAEVPIGIVSIKECPICFTKYHSHLSEMDYNIFLHSVKDGKNLHFKSI